MTLLIVLGGALGLLGLALVWWEIVDFLFDRIDLRSRGGISASD
jgi:hypothetical protein